ncbi:hypothetical protein O181_035138 [Austropuccinia psidii MF-1]|uniref:Uncharacterized protein n=1 Tax=Austropuccinia psidii MF-1 TaxID=1389203 RepID=A0A9Q3D4V8_9BASI|nr:hypothetical protein [Austropuccinia psidii MF-1]
MYCIQCSTHSKLQNLGRTLHRLKHHFIESYHIDPTTSSRISYPRFNPPFSSRLFQPRAASGPPEIITSSSETDILPCHPLHSLNHHPLSSALDPSHLSINLQQDHVPKSAPSSDQLDQHYDSSGTHTRLQEAKELLNVSSHLGGPSDLSRNGARVSHSDTYSNPTLRLNQSHLSPPPQLARMPSLNPSMHSGIPPTSFKDLAVLYQVVAERRTAFDNLLWQVPATSLTAHAFLFSISLAADTGRFARIASMGLCIVITILTLHLFTRQLQAEDADHAWLIEFEERHQIEYQDRAHGARWSEFRDKKPKGAGKLGWLALHRSYPLWSKGMLIIGLLAVAILILAICDSNILLGHNCQLN